MKTTSKGLLIAFAGLGSMFLVGATANAQCGFYRPPAIHPDSYHPQTMSPKYLMVDQQTGEQPTMVGVWKEHWISEGNFSTLGIPDGVELDAVYSEWQSDGTEVNVSGLRAPRTGDVCLGVWQKVGAQTYKLNHFGVSYNPDDTLLGLARIQQTIVLDPSANKITGTFSIDQYDESGDLLTHVQGTLYGHRVTMDTGWEPVE